MWGLLLLAFRSLGASRPRTVLTTTAVVLGVGCIMGSLTAVAAIDASLRWAADEAAGRADLEVRALAEQGFPAAVVEQVRRLEGVALVAPLLEKRTFLRAEGAPAARGFVHLVGLDGEAEAQVRRLTLRDGRWPAPGEAEVALLADWAAGLGLGLGERVELVTREGFRPFEVVGLVDEAGPAWRGFGRVAIVSLQTAQQAFGLGSRISHLALKLTRPGQRERVARALEAVLPGGYVALSPDELGQELRSAAEQLVLGLLVFGVAALFVGAFLINNTINMAVAEQRQQIGLLRAAGVTRDQVLLLVLVQAAGIGLAGSLLGVGAGALLARALASGLAAWARLPPQEVPLPLPGAAASLAVGMLTAVGSALLPAWRASAIAPVAALRRTEAEAAGVGRGNWLTTLGLGVAGGVALAWPLPEAAAGEARAGGVLLCLAAAGVGAVSLVGPLSGLSAAPFRWLLSAEARLAELNLRRAPQRAGLTVVGFTASLALMVALATLGSSARTAGQERVAGLFAGQVLVVSPVPQPSRLLDEFRQQPGAGRVTPLRTLSVAAGSVWLDAVALEPDDYAGHLRGLLVEGGREEAVRRLREGRAVLVPWRLAEARGLRLGDRLPLLTAQGPLDFTVAGLLGWSFPSSDHLGAIVLSRQDAARWLGAEGFSFLAVAAAPGVTPRELAEQLAPVAERFGMEVATVDQVQASVGEGVGRLLALFSGLIGVGMLVAALGIVNTMMMNVAERRREIGVLRALGLTRWQVQAMVLAEAGMMGLMGGLLGVACGLGLGRLLLELARSPDFDPQPVWPLEAAALSLAGAVLVAMVSAVPPAQAAARVHLGRAVVAE